MKKIVLALASTVSVVVLLFGYHTSTSGPEALSTPPAAVSGGTDPTSSGSAGSASRSTTVTGSVAQTQWGPVQVQLTMAGSKIAEVSVVQYPSGNGRDEEINSYALPILIQETIDAQSAQIDMVSGATVTSVGYQQSLQSALDQA